MNRRSLLRRRLGLMTIFVMLLELQRRFWFDDQELVRLVRYLGNTSNI